MTPFLSKFSIYPPPILVRVVCSEYSTERNEEDEKKSKKKKINKISETNKTTTDNRQI